MFHQKRHSQAVFEQAEYLLIRLIQDLRMRSKDKHKKIAVQFTF